MVDGIAYDFNKWLENVNTYIAINIANHFVLNKTSKNDIKFKKNKMLFPFIVLNNDSINYFDTKEFISNKPLTNKEINEFSIDNSQMPIKRFLISNGVIGELEVNTQLLSIEGISIKLESYEQEVTSNFSIFKYRQLYDKCSNDGIYEYTKDAIFNNRIFFSPPFMLNDPFECSYYSLSGNQNLQTNDFKIFSTSKTQCDIPMWAYYGDSHKGVCLEYDLNSVINAVKMKFTKFICSDVIYINKRFTEIELNLYRKHLGDKEGTSFFYLLLSLTKSKMWQNEREFRIIGFNKKLVDIQFIDDEKFNIEDNIVIAPPITLYFGANVKSSFVRTNFVGCTIQKYQMYLGSNEFKLYFK